MSDDANEELRAIRELLAEIAVSLRTEPRRGEPKRRKPPRQPAENVSDLATYRAAALLREFESK